MSALWLISRSDQEDVRTDRIADRGKSSSGEQTIARAPEPDGHHGESSCGGGGPAIPIAPKSASVIEVSTTAVTNVLAVVPLLLRSWRPPDA